MRRLLKWRYAATAAALGLAVACSEDSTNPVAPDNYPPPPTGTLYNVNVTAPNQTFNVGIAQWTTTYPFGVGTGQLDPFLGVQNAPSEEGFNTDASPLPLDDTRSNFTDALPLNNVPIIEESNLLWREFILDANEAQNEGDATFSIDRFDVWVCQDNAAPTYDAVSDFASNSSCTKAYSLPDTLLATSDNTSGSGSTLDYRILIPASAFGAAANTACPYTGAEGSACGYYIVLHTEMGHVGGIYVTGSTFEEFSTIKRPVPPQLTLVKEVINDNGGTAHASAWTLSATGTSFSFSGVGSPATGATASLGPSPVAPGVQYTLAESGGPSGYTAATNWVCTGGGTFVAPDKITLDTAEVVSCKIVNNDNAPQLSLVKEVVNDNGGTAHASAWTLTATGAGGFSGTGSPATGATATVGPNGVTAGVQYTLSESGPSGYTAAANWVCTGGGTFTAPDKITLALGETVSCKMVNNDNGPQLSLVKEVINDNGGSAHASAWTLTATGSGGFSGAGSPATGATATNGPNGVTAGVQYTLSESNGPSGYTAASAWVCTGGGTFVSPDKITLALGETVSCKIVNNDVAPQLSLVKEVVNDNGGTAHASAWTLTATGSGGFSGAGTPATGATATVGPNAVTAGVQYTLSESAGPSGYTAAAAWVCTGGGTFVSPDKITLGVGETASCKIVNNDNAPGLTLVKEVINDNGGTAHASAWTLAASGTSGSFSGAGSPATGATASLGPNSVTAGVQYTLSESGGPSGYTAASAWVCTGGGTFVSPDKITLGVGQSASCKIVNNDVAPQLSLVKEVVNDDGGTAHASAWTLTATGAGGFSGAGSPATGATATNGPNNVTAGVQYTLSESGPAGYSAAAAWICTGGGTFVSPDKITLGVGQTASCKMVNNDNPPSLTLVKEVVNSGGGIAVASAWTLTATGDGGFSGAGTGAGATASNGPNNVKAGVQYALSESGGPAGYTAATAWVCTGGGTFTSPNLITLGLGESATCRIVNTFVPVVTTEGCTPGFWSENGIRLNAWPAPYAPNQLVSSMFAATFGNGGAYLGSATLLTALEGYPDLKGKRSSINGAKEILIRAAVAAVLNETAFGALYPAADATTLKADVVAALNSNNRETILELAATLDAWNNNYLLDSNGDVVIDPNTGLPVTTGTCPLPRPIV